MAISCDIAPDPRLTCMNARTLVLALSLLLSLTACGSDDSYMTRHQVCERITTAACDRLVDCEPLLAQDGCIAREMTRCCPDGVCAEPVVATEERLAACETAVAATSCSQLTDGDLPPSCDGLTDPVPEELPDASPPPGDGSGGPATGDGVLEVRWQILGSGGATLSCSQFSGTDKIRIVATPPGGAPLTRDFTCVDLSGLANLPSGIYSIVAQARAGSTVVQQTEAQTVTVSPSYNDAFFIFNASRSFGSYCTQLATAACNACAPSDASCTTDFIGSCCANDGQCNSEAYADPQAFSQCLSAFSTGSYCSSLPPACQNVIGVY